MPRIVRVDMLVVWLFFLLLLGTPLGLLVADHFGRKAVFETGQRIEAVVAYRPVDETRWGRACSTLFAFRAAGRIVSFKRPECKDEWAVGKRVAIVYDPAEPDGAFPVSEGSWFRGKGWIAAALAAALVALSVYFLVPAFREPRKPSQNRVDERRRRP